MTQLQPTFGEVRGLAPDNALQSTSEDWLALLAAFFGSLAMLGRAWARTLENLVSATENRTQLPPHPRPLPPGERE
jgi:hypothetical protein